mmetsp:Transcript_23031/g.43287  ORF Transcript_23031/g.43287 Transcript_23031/m.43287 type:complete len:213 (+) Transcript_23031:1371-2009(+)
MATRTCLVCSCTPPPCSAWYLMSSLNSGKSKCPDSSLSKIVTRRLISDCVKFRPSAPVACFSSVTSMFPVPSLSTMSNASLRLATPSSVARIMRDVCTSLAMSFKMDCSWTVRLARPAATRMSMVSASSNSPMTLQRLTSDLAAPFITTCPIMSLLTPVKLAIAQATSFLFSVVSPSLPSLKIQETMPSLIILSLPSTALVRLATAVIMSMR